MLQGPHHVLSTSVRNGGQLPSLRFIANHQSCEASGHKQRHDFIAGSGQEAYHDSTCEEMSLPADQVALMGTAANMNYAALVTAKDHGLEVTAVVTAGVQGNACCAGDPAVWREGDNGWEKIGGTINTMLLINRSLTAGTFARAAVTMTEAKSTALTRLAVRSLYSQDLATGTGTDQFAIAAPSEGTSCLTSASPHGKLGELIGCTVRDATLEALRWQNGLEPSYTRGVFTALARFGLREETFFDDIQQFLSESDLELIKKNSLSVFHEPLVGAAAHAMAAVMDRVRFDTLPHPTAPEALRHQAALMAASLSAKPHLWNAFRAALTETGPRELALHAIAIGWTEKWRT